MIIKSFLKQRLIELSTKENDGGIILMAAEHLSASVPAIPDTVKHLEKGLPESCTWWDAVRVNREDLQKKTNKLGICRRHVFFCRGAAGPYVQYWIEGAAGPYVQYWIDERKQ